MAASSPTQPHGERSQLELELEHNREAPSHARAAIAGFSEQRNIDPSSLATLILLVSEVVTNAVIHPVLENPGVIRLAARCAGGVIRVEVTDGGNGFNPGPRDPERPDRGYGLYLLDKQASAWGIERHSGNTVWFELRV